MIKIEINIKQSKTFRERMRDRYFTKCDNFWIDNKIK